MTALSQLLGAVPRWLAHNRGAEQAFGVPTIRSLDKSERSLGGYVIRPFSAQATPARKHKLVDRGAKLRARRRLTGEAIQLGTTYNTLFSERALEKLGLAEAA